MALKNNNNNNDDDDENNNKKLSSAYTDGFSPSASILRTASIVKILMAIKSKVSDT
jgi:hypothetical protein